MCKLISKWEHFKGLIEEVDLPSGFTYEYYFTKKRYNEKQLCVGVYSENNNKRIQLSYFIGIDWIIKGALAIYVEPKINETSNQTDYLKMLFKSLKHPDLASYTGDLFQIKFNEPFIEIEQNHDLLMPLLVVQYLLILKGIVRKGLKKSYYRKEENLRSRIKGKVLIAKTIKRNVINNKLLSVYCNYEEFGYDNLENRLLKKAFVFAQRYLSNLKIANSNQYISELSNYIAPAFEYVSDEVNLNEIKGVKSNVFYKEYKEGIRLAKLIIKLRGFNIYSNKQNSRIKTPPFWIDMSKLFELYALGLLKERFGSMVYYQFATRGNELDYLIKSSEYRMVVDAKYKLAYQDGLIHKDMRQVSGYARLKLVYDKLEKVYSEIIDCLIIYPDQKEGYITLNNINLKEREIDKYVQLYKVAIKLPII